MMTVKLCVWTDDVANNIACCSQKSDCV